MAEKLIPMPGRTAYPPARELWQIPGIAAAVAIFVVAAWLARNPLEKPSSAAADIAALRASWESGDTLASAGGAERFLARHKGLDRKDEALARFILAASRWDLTRSNPATTRKDLEGCLSAFQQALSLGLQPAQEAAALRARGDISLRLSQVADAVQTYTTLLERHSEEKGALLTLALAYVDMKPPMVERANECVERYFILDGLVPEEIQDGFLARADIALRTHDFDAAAYAARQVIDAKATGERAARAAVLLARALAARGGWKDALAVLDSVDAAGAGRYEAALSLERARALWMSGGVDDGRKALDETIFRFPGTAEALSARFELARLLFDAEQLAAAKDALVSLLDDMAAQQSRGTDSFGVDDVTDLWMAVGKAILAASDYKAAHDFHSAAAALMTEGHFLFFDATLYLREAEQLQSRLPGLPSLDTPSADAAVRNAYREAGRTFARALDTAAGDIFDAALFEAGHSFFMAGEYAQALHFLRRFGEEGMRDERMPRALYDEAGALAALGNDAPAIEVCRRNVRMHPTNIYAYRSVLLQADLYRHMGGENAAFAVDLYQDILTGGRFQPASSEWRSALFALGTTLYETGRYRDAVLKLEEALDRYPDDPAAPEARLCLGLASREAALRDPAARQSLLASAARTFASIAADESEAGGVRAHKAAFLEADCYYDMGDYRKALSLYDKAVEARVDTPEATRGLFWIANCYYRLGLTLQAEAAYKRALFNLKRFEPAPAPGGEFYSSLPVWRGGEVLQ